MAERRAYRIDDAVGDTTPRIWLRMLFAVLAVAPGIIRVGWRIDDPLMALWLTHALQLATLAAFAVVLLKPDRAEGPGGVLRRLRGNLFESAVLVIALAFMWAPAVLALAAGALVVGSMLRLYFLLLQTDVPSGIVFVGSFVVLIAVGAAFLKLPAATPPDQPITTLDSVFTVTSAISQTGLVVRPTGEGFTRFGHIVILVWIQVGALGVILFGSIFALFLGSSFGLKATQTLADPTEQGWAGQLSLKKLVVFIIVVTHALELIGVGFLYFSWPEDWVGAPEMDSPGDRLFHSVFFSVSSFCNAGFVTTSNSLNGLRAHWTSHFVVAPLIVIGSIGFPVLDDLWRAAWAKIRRRRVSRGTLIRLGLNSKIVLATTAIIYILGGLVVFLGETTQAQQPTGLALLDAHFMVVNRTSGFDTIPPADMGLLSQLMLILLMFIGGSPGSVAGGIKVMCLAVLALTVWSTITGRRETTAFKRTIPDELVRKCATLIVLCLATVMTIAGVLAAVETGGPDGHRLEELIFEAVSAFGTCGLSLGVTSDLSPAGKGALIVAMFVGRVGPLATLAALVLVARDWRARYEYPTESVVIY